MGEQSGPFNAAEGTWCRGGDRVDRGSWSNPRHPYPFWHPAVSQHSAPPGSSLAFSGTAASSPTGSFLSRGAYSASPVPPLSPLSPAFLPDLVRVNHHPGRGLQAGGFLGEQPRRGFRPEGTWLPQDREPQDPALRELPPFGVRTEAAAAAAAAATASTSTSTSTSTSNRSSFNSDVEDLVTRQAYRRGSNQGCVPNLTPRQQQHSFVGCNFCKKNGELPTQYMSHTLHTRLPCGKRVVQCPVLLSVRCAVCGASGEDAHTLSYCPQNKSRPIAILLKNTPRRSDGTFRKKVNNNK